MTNLSSVDNSHSRGVHSGVPSFFRALCFEASRGGTNGYSNPGWHLASALGSQSPYDLEEYEWADEVEKIKALLDEDDDKLVIAWFMDHYPRCMALVPSRRCEQFVAGVRRAFEEGRIEL